MVVKEVPIQWTQDLSIYASEQYLKVAGDEYGWLGGFDAGGGLRCVLPYTVIRKPLVRMVRFRVETMPIGPALEIAEEKAFLNGVVQHFRARKADLIIPATTNTIFRSYPDGAVAAPYGSYVINLAQPEETIWGKLNSSHRRKVRLATKAEVRIVSGTQYLETAFELVRETFQRSRMGFMGLESFQRLVGGLGDQVRIFAAEHQGKVQAANVVPFSRHCAYYLYGGSIPEPAAGATNLLHWESMRTFQGLGVRQYDFVGVRINPAEGSKQEGLKSFKERFGGELVQGFMWKYSFSPLKYWAYCQAVRLLRGGDIVDQERRKLEAVRASAGRTGSTACLASAAKEAPERVV